MLQIALKNNDKCLLAAKGPHGTAVFWDQRHCVEAQMLIYLKLCLSTILTCEVCDQILLITKSWFFLISRVVTSVLFCVMKSMGLVFFQQKLVTRFSF